MSRASFAIIECDLDFHITSWNHAAEATFGYTAAEAIGRSCLVLIVHPDERETLRAAWNRLTTGEEVAANPVLHVTKGGSIISCEWCSAPFFEHDGKVQGILSLVQDVTERVQTERAIREREALVGNIVASLSAHVAVVNRDGLVISMNSNWKRYAWHQRNPLLSGVDIGTNYLDVCRRGAEANRALRDSVRALETVIQGKAAQFKTEYVIEEPGNTRWFMMSGSAIGNPSKATIVSHRDITQTKQIDHNVLLTAVFENVPEGIFILDSTARIMALNRAFTAITGFDAQDVTGRRPTWLAGFQPNSASYRAIARCLRKETHWQGELVGQRKSGESFPLWLTLHKIQDHRGGASQLLGVFSDLARSKTPHTEPPNGSACRDNPTNLPNRTQLAERLRVALSKARRYSRRIAVLSFDLDRFKLINNSLGHAVGDELIRNVAERLVRLVRESDTVAHLSGDEFIVLLDELSQTTDAARVAGKMTHMMSEPFVIGGQELFATASIGISVFPDDADSEATLLQHANTAVDRAKETGGNNYKFFAEQMNTTSVERLWLENGLRKALNEGQFELRYQPIINLQTGEVCKLEALLRWCDTTRGWIPPATFIPVAEATGLILPLSDWVLQEACRQHGAWRNAGLSPVTATVNFSAHQFRQPDLVALVRQSLDNAAIEPEALEIELTESSLMHNPDTAIEMLREFKNAGIRIAIDDFGTGYSSLSYLRRFPIDVVKIDRSFVTDVHVDPEDAEITSAIIAMAHKLHLEVVAEGVENEDQLHFLRSLGCDSAQGFYFSQAVSSGDVPGLCTRVCRTTDNIDPSSAPPHVS